MGELLVTGFGPFPGVRVNPTTALAQAVADRLGGPRAKVRALILPTTYGTGLPLLRQALTEFQPEALLMLGLAARARKVRVECFARGRSSQLAPDASGKAAARVEAPSPSLPVKARGDVHVALASLRRAGIGARLSHSAGRYLCNAGYISALTHPAIAGRPVIFIHIPWPRGARPGNWRPDPDRLAAALADIARSLRVQARRARTGQPRLA
jgi:pyroglutamyl-peptidase